MSEFLGFQPTDRPGYFFLSYNSEDAARAEALARGLRGGGVPLWYDYGIPYNEKWQEVISQKIADSAGVLLFFTRGILEKPDSFVQREYRIAKLMKRPVTVVLLDGIADSEVPPAKASFWVELLERQCIPAYQMETEKQCAEVMKAIGMATHEDRMNQLIVRYHELYDAERYDEAEAYLNDYMHDKTMRGKAEVIAHISMGIPGVTVQQTAEKLEEPPETLTLENHHIPGIYQCYRLRLDSAELIIASKAFTLAIDWFFLWRDSTEIMIGMYPHMDIRNIIYDERDDILYICCESYLSGRKLSVIAVEHPAGDAVCTSIDFPL